MWLVISRLNLWRKHSSWSRPELNGVFSPVWDEFPPSSKAELSSLNNGGGSIHAFFFAVADDGQEKKTHCCCLEKPSIPINLPFSWLVTSLLQFASTVTETFETICLFLDFFFSTNSYCLLGLLKPYFLKPLRKSDPRPSPRKKKNPQSCIIKQLKLMVHRLEQEAKRHRKHLVSYVTLQNTHIRPIKSNSYVSIASDC